MKEIHEELIKFQKDRVWKKFHTTENLAKSISIGVVKLLEHFQWQKEHDKNPEKALKLTNEIIKNAYRTLMACGIKEWYTYLKICCYKDFLKKNFDIKIIDFQ